MTGSPDYSMSDDKDWTWVLDRPCPDCGYDGSTVTTAGVATAIRDQVARFQQLGGSDLATQRPSEQVWSAHEYICHVRDVYDLYAVRLELMLTEDDPLFADWSPDETARADRYDRQDPKQALVDLDIHGNRLADMFAALSEDQWARPGRRSDGAEFTIATFGRYLVHDPHHHLWDVEAGYRALGRHQRGRQSPLKPA